MVASMQIGQSGPYLEAIATARAAAYKIFLVIDRVSNVRLRLHLHKSTNATPQIIKLFKLLVKNIKLHSKIHKFVCVIYFNNYKRYRIWTIGDTINRIREYHQQRQTKLE